MLGWKSLHAKQIGAKGGGGVRSNWVNVQDGKSRKSHSSWKTEPFCIKYLKYEFDDFPAGLASGAMLKHQPLFCVQIFSGSTSALVESGLYVCLGVTGKSLCKAYSILSSDTGWKLVTGWVSEVERPKTSNNHRYFH